MKAQRSDFASPWLAAFGVLACFMAGVGGAETGLRDPVAQAATRTDTAVTATCEISKNPRMHASLSTTKPDVGRRYQVSDERNESGPL